MKKNQRWNNNSGKLILLQRADKIQVKGEKILTKPPQVLKEAKDPG